MQEPSHELGYNLKYAHMHPHSLRVDAAARRDLALLILTTISVLSLILKLVWEAISTLL